MYDALSEHRNAISQDTCPRRLIDRLRAYPPCPLSQRGAKVGHRGRTSSGWAMRRREMALRRPSLAPWPMNPYPEVPEAVTLPLRTSSGWAMRRRGMARRRPSLASSLSTCDTSIGVSVAPGPTQFTWQKESAGRTTFEFE
jgi:hypothetical protein